MTKKPQECPNRIREWRKARGHTLTVVASLSGITPTHLSRMEVGDRSVTIEHLRLLGRVLNVSAGELLHLDDNPDLPNFKEAEILTGLRLGDERLLQSVQSLIDANKRFIA